MIIKESHLAFCWMVKRCGKLKIIFTKDLRGQTNQISVVMGGDSWPEGCGFKLQHCKLDWHFSHLFVVKIVMFVWKDYLINEKEAGDSPFNKTNQIKVVYETSSTFWRQKIQIVDRENGAILERLFSDGWKWLLNWWMRYF